MIGIGTWSAKVSTMFLKMEGTIEILDNNGEYEFRFHPPEKFKDVQIRYFDIREEGNTLYGKGEASAFPGKIFEVQATFDGDKMTLKREMDVTGPLNEIEWQTGVLVSPTVMLRKQWENMPFKTPFYINVMNEGIRI